MRTAFDPGAVLAAPLVATLSTAAADGAPRNAPVWFHWERRALWMPGGMGSASTRRLATDPRCAVEIVEYDNDRGVMRHLGLRGRAEIRPMDPEIFRRLLARYLGAEPTWNPWFLAEIARIEDPDGRLIRLEPDSVFTNDVSFFRTGPDRANAARAGNRSAG